MGKNTLLLFLLYFSFSHTSAQDVKFEHFTIENGLSQNSVKCIYQDRKGYIWIGTEDGLSRYDGYSYTVFRPKIDDTTSLSDNIITSIYEDYQENLWVLTFNGNLNKFNWETGTFKQYLIGRQNNLNSVPFNAVARMYEDKQHNLWAYNKAVYVYQPKTDNFKQLYLNLNISDPLFLFFYQDTDQLFWIGTNNGLYKYNWSKGTYKVYKLPSVFGDTLKNEFFSIAEDPGGIFWLGTSKGLFKFNKNSDEFISYWKINNTVKTKMIHTDIPSIINDGQSLWLSWQTWNNNTIGISKFNKTTTEFSTHAFNDDTLMSPSNNVPINMFEDRSGGLWVGTFLKGIYYFEKKQKFQTLMRGNTICSFLEDKNGFLWISTSAKGLFKYDEKSHTLTNVSTRKQNTAINVLYEDSKGYIWFGTYEGLYRMTHIVGEKPKVEQMLHGIVKAIVEDLQHRYWIGFEGGLCLYYPDKKKTLYFYTKSDNPNSISSNSIESLLLDNKTGDLWVATWDGLNHLILPKSEEIAENNIKFNTLKHIPNDNNSISDNRVISLCFDKKGLLWAGTSGGGMNSIRVDINDGTETYFIKQYTKENGMPNNVVYGILNDNDNNIWISTNEGLSKYNQSNKLFTSYDKSDGLQNNQFFWRACSKGASGKFYFGGLNGYNAFYPASVVPNLYVPPVYITGFSIFNKLQMPGVYNSPLRKQISETKVLIINYDQSVISFEYVALNYISTIKNQYAYKLEGFDEDWQQVGTQRKATYTNLDPGKYVFKVKASNNDGIWNDKGASLTLIIKPPFWKTIWFRLLVICSFISSLIAFYYLRESYIRQKNRLLKQLVDERTLEIKKKNEALLEHTNKLKNTNALLEKGKQEIEGKNKLLTEQAENLNKSNKLLTERQLQIVEQSEALNSTNTLLEERQQQIEEQSEELMAQRDELSQLNTTKDKLFSILAHDLKTPFNTILGFSDLLIRNISTYDKDKIKERVTFIRDASKHTYDLLSNLLDWSRTQRGMIEFDPELLKISELLEQELYMLRQQALRKEIGIELQMQGSEVSVNADPNMISTVMRNLISNAIKFSYNKSTITVKMEFLEKEFRFSVTDTGQGINDEVKEKLFKVSEHVTTSGTAGEKGTGLGLILCSDFIGRHKGSLQVKSELNKGTTMLFVIPIIKN